MSRELEMNFEAAVEEYERINSSRPRGILEYYILTLLRQGKSVQEAAQIASADHYRADDPDYVEYMYRKCARYEVFGEW